MARSLRQLHLYLGVLFAPAILFFAFTGALQTYDLHESGSASGYAAPKWVKSLASVHKHQTLKLREKPKPVPAATAPKIEPAAAKTVEAPKKAPRLTLLMLKAFFFASAIGLMLSSLIGLYLAFRFSRQPRLTFALLVIGTAVPIALLLA